MASVSLFGYYAKGTALPAGGIDLKIEKGQLKSLFQLSEFRLAIEDTLKLLIDLARYQNDFQTVGLDILNR